MAQVGVNASNILQHFQQTSNNEQEADVLAADQGGGNDQHFMTPRNSLSESTIEVGANRGDEIATAKLNKKEHKALKVLLKLIVIVVLLEINVVALGTMWRCVWIQWFAPLTSR